MSFIEVTIILGIYSFFTVIFIYFYLHSKISYFRIEKINDYMNVRKEEFNEKFKEGIKKIREANINLQHDFIRFDRLRGATETIFKIIEDKLQEVNRFNQDLEKTSAFYHDLQDTFKENNLRLQEFVSKLNNFEDDLQTKEGMVKELEGLIVDFKKNFEKEIFSLEKGFGDRLQVVEKNVDNDLEKMVNLSQINVEKIKQQYTVLEASLKEKDNLRLQEFVSKLNNFEDDLQTKEGMVKELEGLIVDFKKNFEKEIFSLEKGFGDRLQVVEKNVDNDLEKMVNLSQINVEKIKQQYTVLEASLKEKDNLRLQEFVSKLNNFEDDLQTKEGMVKELEGLIVDFKKNFEKEIFSLEKNFGNRLQIMEEDISRDFERLVNLNQINADKIKQHYVDLEVDFKDSIDNLTKEEKSHLQGEIEVIRSGAEAEIVSLQSDLKQQGNKVNELRDRYSDWEKEITEYRKKSQERIDRFSETVLSQLKDKIDDYQKEILGLLEQRYKQLNKQTLEIETRNQLKDDTLDGLSIFIEEAKKTVTYQINNLSNFLEEQKNLQGGLYQKNQIVLLDTFKDIKKDFLKLQEDIFLIQKDEKNILKKINDYLEVRLNQIMEQESLQVLQKIFDDKNISTDFGTQHKRFLQKIEKYFTKKIKNSVTEHTPLLIEKLRNDPEWKKVLQKQAEVSLISKVETEKIFNEVKRNFNKEYFKKELNQEIQNYKQGFENISKDWNKLSNEVGEKKKFLDRMLVQGEDKIEHLVEGIKLSLADKELILQDIFNEKIVSMEKKMATVTERIEFFLNKTKSIDKIFIFQKEFSDVMSNYQKQLSNLKKTDKRFVEFRENFQKLEKENHRIETLHKGLLEKENKVLSLEKQLDAIVSMTHEIQDNIETVNQQSTEVDRFMKSLQTYDQEISVIKKDFGSLREFQSEFQDVKNLVGEIRSQSQQNYEKAELFISKVTAGEDLQKKIIDQIKEVEEKSISLDDRYKALEYFNKKFDEFDMAVYDVEKRIETIKSLKKEMAMEQANLNLLKEGFNEQISIILKIFQNQTGNDGKIFTELDKKFKSLPKTLNSIGWSDKEIAKHLNMELYEVQLLLNPKKRKK